MKKILMAMGVIIIVALAGRLSWAYWQTKVVDQQKTILQTSKSESAQKGSSVAVIASDVLVEHVKDWFAHNINANVKDIETLEITRQTWPDVCLGLAGEDEVCEIKSTAGYDFRFNIKGEDRQGYAYVVHSNLDGTWIGTGGLSPYVATGVIEEKSIDSSKNFSKDLVHVYYYGKIIPGADPETFTIISNKVVKDKNSVYFYIENMKSGGSWSKINAEASSFEVLLKDIYFRDSTHVYFEGEIIPELKPKTTRVFEWRPEIIADDNLVYIVDLDAHVLGGESFAKVAGVDALSFVVSKNNPLFASDKKNQYKIVETSGYHKIITIERIAN